MSQEDVLKRARQLKNQKTSIVGAGSSLPPAIEVQEDLSEHDPEPLTRKFKPSLGKQVIEATSQHSTSQLQTLLLQQQVVDDTLLSFWSPTFPHSNHSRKHELLRHDATSLQT
ncbi:hypothetical protein DEO72_LG4g1141 [Vigna unguiculata]|uniref:Uncharacterized protein n=1 Tax=Vigna unguiculata TaxID=3917 RepID=A0A4D6LPW0_VIGUN|nr:hypothetical protein DEO72_LG4g1141 [Vigna unguiculata]